MDSQEKKYINLSEFYLYIWKKRVIGSKHYSEVSGKRLGKEPLSIYFHHILPKKKYPLLMFDEENIILLTGEEHEKVEQDMYFYEKVNEKRETLKSKYNL
jgi:hypothetical protein